MEMRAASWKAVVGVALGLGLLGAPALAVQPSVPALVDAHGLAARSLLNAEPSTRLDPDGLRGRPEPTPTPTPQPSASPTSPVAALVAIRTRVTIPPPSITAASAVLYDVDTGRILWARDPQTARPVASIAKIFTAMVASNLMPADRLIQVPDAVTALPWDSTMMGLTPGETLSVRELLDGALLVSGNDAAVSLAQGVTSPAAFVGDMNALAARIGLHTTHFVNPVGLDDPAQYSSAMDLVAAALYLDRNYPGLARIASTGEISLLATSTHKAYTLQNVDKLLFTYPGVTGLKGGYTALAGGCVLTTATLAGHHIVAVVLGSPPLPSPGAFADMRALLDYAAARYRG